MSGSGSEDLEAIQALVTGDDIQHVGFRAMIQKLAIALNLAGSARNNTDGSMVVRLQGLADRTVETVDAMKAGSKKSSRNNHVSQSPINYDPTLNTFTVFAWTSVSRNITTPYDLVFTLRQGDAKLSHDAAKAE